MGHDLSHVSTALPLLPTHYSCTTCFSCPPQVAPVQSAEVLIVSRGIRSCGRSIPHTGGHRRASTAQTESQEVITAQQKSQEG